MNLKIFDGFLHVDGPYAALFKLFLSTKKCFHNWLSEIKVIYGNYKGWGRIFHAFPVMRVFDGRALFVSLSVPPL